MRLMQDAKTGPPDVVHPASAGQCVQVCTGLPLQQSSNLSPPAVSWLHHFGGGQSTQPKDCRRSTQRSCRPVTCCLQVKASPRKRGAYAGMQAPSTGNGHAEGTFLFAGEGHTPQWTLEIPKGASPGPQDRRKDM